MTLAETLNALLTTARRVVEHSGRSEADAQAKDAKLTAENEAYAESPPDHHREVIAKYTKRYRVERLKAAGIGVFNLSHALPGIRADLRELRDAHRRAPDAVAAYVARTGTTLSKVDDFLRLQLQVVDELRRQRFDREFSNAPPSTIARMYEAARFDFDDESGSFVRWVEARHGDGWHGPTPAETAQIEAAKGLRKAIADARESRIPADLHGLDATIAEAERLVNRAGLAGVVPINPRMDTDAAKAYETVLRALDEAAG